MDELYGVVTKEQLFDKLAISTRRVSFGNEDRKPVITDDVFGLITLEHFFDDNEYGGDFEFISLEELDETEKEYNWTELNEGYTYNDNGYIERDIVWRLFENDDTEEVIVFFSIHVGLDARWGFSEAFPVMFDSEYDFLEYLSANFPLVFAEFEAEQDGVVKKMYAEVFGSATSEYLDFYVATDDSEREEVIQDQVFMTTYDKEDFISDLKDELSQSDIKLLKVTHLSNGYVG